MLPLAILSMSHFQTSSHHPVTQNQVPVPRPGLPFHQIPSQPPHPTQAPAQAPYDHHKLPPSLRALSAGRTNHLTTNPKYFSWCSEGTLCISVDAR